MGYGAEACEDVSVLVFLLNIIKCQSVLLSVFIIFFIFAAKNIIE